jgi:hypothetical protein
MKKYIFGLILILGSLNFPALAQTRASELIKDIRGMTPAAYYGLSQQAEQFYRQQNFEKAAEVYEKLTKAYP